MDREVQVDLADLANPVDRVGPVGQDQAVTTPDNPAVQVHLVLLEVQVALEDLVDPVIV